jgi:hypothetical protein
VANGRVDDDDDEDDGSGVTRCWHEAGVERIR